ncbi:MAG: polysaccharide pyruvyl transferase family protein [Ruminococcus flavefaciens]|nr:polysaccharide pyruvyl transferase family protein [Ruminococcus flavefaciens]
MGECCNAGIGILTFHCSDNFGAMLQAYGLKNCLCDMGVKADIIRYEPFFMTGRHWFIPYVPCKGENGQKWYGWDIWYARYRMTINRGMGKAFFQQRNNMRCFREKNLINKNQRKILIKKALGYLPYQYYIVGSDQIWNPEITFGLRKAYFGAFRNRHKKKVVSYGASMGSSVLAPQYDEEFSRLIQSVDAISVREKDAIPYVRRFCEREVIAVLDPVFFLNQESWQKIEKLPEQKQYILVYITEKNQELSDYVWQLSEEKDLAVIEVYGGGPVTGAGFEMVFTAGPAEFLGYIHGADYVVTNSFHAVAFSIIYQKKFIAFLHSSRGSRIRNIMQIHGLENRLYQTGEKAEIDSYVDWEAVRHKTEESIQVSNEFLIKNLAD